MQEPSTRSTALEKAKTYGLDVFRAATVDLVAKGLTGLLVAAVAGLGVLVWQGGSVPAWTAVLAVLIVVALAVGLGARAGQRRAELEGDFGLAAWAVERYELYTDHVADVLDRLQRVLVGDLEGVAIPDYIERGIVEPARDVLQGPHEDIRISVLLPQDDDRWRMAWAAGHSLDGRRKYNERITDTLSRDPYESGEAEYWPDVTIDDRFRPNPRSSRPFYSMLSQPLRAGDTIVGVLNVVSSVVDAFDAAEQRYVASLASVIGVALGVYLSQEDPGDSE
jgi:hypothetical protein